MDKTNKKAAAVESLRNGFSKNNLSPGISWREWKKQRREQHQQWKEAKLLKQLSKQQKNVPSSSEKIEKCSYTVSIALPGSILDIAQTPSLKAHLVANIARSAAIFRVNEVVVFSDSSLDKLEDHEENLKLHQKHRGCLHMFRILEFMECPPYLRKYYFPIHKDLEHAGEVRPLQIPSHLGVDDESEYREGIVLNKPIKPGKGSYVNIGLQKSCIIDVALKENVRVTVQLDKEQKSKKHYRGKAVSPRAPLKYDNIYWGYSVRLAKNLPSVFSGCPYAGGYDLTIGTSDKGKNVDSVDIPKFKHMLIVFGGKCGLEVCLEDEEVEADDPSELFHHYLNVCPHQGTRTIRTEEAIITTLATLRPKIFKAQEVA